MFKSIFGKQYAMYLGTVIVSFLLLGTVVSQVYRAHYIDTQVNRLASQSEKIAGLISEKSFLGAQFSLHYMGMANRVKIVEEMGIITKYMDTSLIVVGPDYNVYFAVDKFGYDLDYINENLDLSRNTGITTALNGDPVRLQGTLSNIYDEEKLTVGYPIIADSMSGDQVIGAVFLSTSLGSLNANISEVGRMIIICVLITAGIAFILLYVSSLGISRPLKQMNDAAKVIANGEFEKRIEVDSYDEVGQLAESFNYMAKSLEAQENTRKEFIANISHDLRSPLTSIIGFLQAMKDGTIGEDKRDYYLNIVLDECVRLSKLANDILDLSNIQTLGDITVLLEEFDINELIRKTIIQFENRITGKNIALSVAFADEMNVVKADYEKIQRVIYNLMDNAVKFTPREGSIALETTVKGEKVYISIKDSGKGLTAEEKERIFERFYKADASRGYDRTGSGLGLSIAKEFIRAHGEKIFINSEEGMGCEFIITLPAVKMPENDK